MTYVAHHIMAVIWFCRRAQQVPVPIALVKPGCRLTSAAVCAVGPGTRQGDIPAASTAIAARRWPRAASAQPHRHVRPATGSAVDPAWFGPRLLNDDYLAERSKEADP